MEKKTEKDFICQLLTPGVGGGFVARYTTHVSAKDLREAEIKAEAMILENSFAKRFYPTPGARIECQETD